MQQDKKFWWVWPAVGLAFLLFLFAVRAILLPFVVGMTVAYLLDPAADRLEHRGFSRLTATVLITCVFFTTLLAGGMVLLPVAFDQLSALAGNLPAALHSVQVLAMEWSARVMNKIDPAQLAAAKTAAAGLSARAVAFVGEVAQNVVTSGAAVFNLLSLLFLTPVVTFYLLRDWDRMVARIDGLLPQRAAPVIRVLACEVSHTLSAFIRGQLYVCLLLGGFYALGLTFVGLNYGFVIGAISGLLTFIPFVGVLFGLSVGCAVAWFQFGAWLPVALVAGVFAAGQFMEGNFVTPKLVGEKVGLHPLWIIFGMMAGAALFGFVGMFIGVPVTAMIGVLVRHGVVRYQRSALYTGV